MDDDRFAALNWWPELMDAVQAELERLEKYQNVHRPGIEGERAELNRKIRGWKQSLGNPDLESRVRGSIESEWAAAASRIEDIERSLSELDGRENLARQSLDPSEVLRRLDRLSDVLANYGPTRGNLELSLHIDRITCKRDGTLELRMCKLGALPEIIEALTILKPNGESQPSTSDGELGCCKDEAKREPRCRGRLRITELDDDAVTDSREIADFAASSDRFAGLGEEWFWTDVLQIPVELSWPEEHASDVAALRKTGLTHARLAMHFGKSVPTIREALRNAEQLDTSLGELPRRMPRARWHEDNALEIARLKATGMGTNDLVRHFQKSDVTIRKALDYSKIIAQQNGSSAGHARSADPSAGD